MARDGFEEEAIGAPGRSDAEVWFVNAFTSPVAGGNPTAVVFADGLAPGRYGEIARALRVPDTAFLLSGDEWQARFYSPLEGEMAFCGQGLLSASAVLRAAGLVSGTVPIRTTTGRVWLASQPDHVERVQLPRDRVFLMENVEPAGPALGLARVQQDEQRTVDSGRKRVFLRLETPEALSAIRVGQDAVLTYCERNAVSGVCLWAPLRGHALAMRVFTRSLGGAEDASTGGAALGLACLLPPGSWRIEQGAGSFLQRGTLFIDSGSEPDHLVLSGRVERTVRGRLASSIR